MGKNNMDNQMDIKNFLINFFTSNDCEVIQESPGKITIQLTVEMDKALMNRPFYWHYIEATGNVGKPKKITFITDYQQVSDEGEWVHFGSPRLWKIYDHLSRTAKFVHLFEKLAVTKNTMLHPWLTINVCIIYEGKQKKEKLFSIGLNLINGIFIFNMMEKLDQVKLSPTISDHCYTISTLIKIQIGYARYIIYHEI